MNTEDTDILAQTEEGRNPEVAAQESELAAAEHECSFHPGFQRLHRVEVNGLIAMLPVDRFCVECGLVAEGLVLHPDDLAAANQLIGFKANSRTAIDAKTPTTADDSAMPDTFHFAELGLVRILHSSALLRGYPTDRASLEPILRGMLGLSDANKERVLAAPGFVDIRATLDTIGHIFEPDPATGRPDRIDDGHLNGWPLIPATLSQPFEIWKQQPAGPSNNPGWAFLACYQLEGHFLYHQVWVDRKRLVRTSYMLAGRAQAKMKRRGIPIYAAYC